MLSILIGRDRNILKSLAWTKLQNSLLFRLGGMIAAITLLAILGMSTSWMVAETTQGSGQAINIAGSLRMQSWRMASIHQQLVHKDDPLQRTRLEQAITQFEQDLTSDSIQSVLPTDANGSLRFTYEAIQTHWQQNIMPALQIISASSNEELLSAIPYFVDTINYLVKQIEEATEAKILVLRIVLGVAVIGTLLMVLLSIYLIRNILVNPLKDLLSLTDQIRRGNLTVRSGLKGEDEIGYLGRAFDLMAEDLFKLYRDLETRVEQKTEELTRSNRSLDLLYRSIIQLHGISPSREVFYKVLKDAEATLGLGVGTLCLKGDHDKQGTVIATTAPNQQSPLCLQMANCEECQNTKTVGLEPATQSGRPIIRLPLTNTDRHYGLLAIDIPADKQAELWQLQLLEALSHHISVTLASEQRIEQNRRVALLEERAVIARELHDSLAQSLAYMKIQVSRLRMAIQNPATAHEVAEALEELREGLHCSYQQLRELLSTFRLRMEGADLGMALAQTTAEFAERGDFPIQLDIDLGVLHLTPNEEIHLLQIVREGLSNILKHARAQQAWVSLKTQDTNKVELLIEDNGIGIQANASLHHYGITIMNERAQALGGKLVYYARPQGGTGVRLIFTPHQSSSSTPMTVEIPYAA